MFKSKNGKSYGSAYVGKKHDAAHDEAEAKHGAMKTEVKEPKEKVMGHDESGMDHNEPDGDEQNPVVAEHGPAVHVHIKHDHVANKHHVTSTHEDGHTEEGDYETPEQAWEEGGKFANISLKKLGKAGDQQGAASEGDNEEVNDGDGFEMPPLV